MFTVHNEAPSGRRARLDSSCFAVAMNACPVNKTNDNDSDEEWLLKLKSLMYFLFIYHSILIITVSFIIITQENLINEKLIEWVWCCSEEMAAHEYEQVRKAWSTLQILKGFKTCCLYQLISWVTWSYY